MLSVRAYDTDAMMVDAAITEGNVLDSVLQSFLANEEVAFVFVHNAAQGCWAGRVERL
jgi:hypothetical protein